MAGSSSLDTLQNFGLFVVTRCAAVSVARQLGLELSLHIRVTSNYATSLQILNEVSHRIERPWVLHHVYFPRKPGPLYYNATHSCL
jgi:hypothetical protein